MYVHNTRKHERTSWVEPYTIIVYVHTYSSLVCGYRHYLSGMWVGGYNSTALLYTHCICILTWACKHAYAHGCLHDAQACTDTHAHYSHMLYFYCRFLDRPVTVACGHSFCQDCLSRSFDHTPFCPICRAPLGEVMIIPYHSGHLNLTFKVSWLDGYVHNTSVLLSHLQSFVQYARLSGNMVRLR